MCPLFIWQCFMHTVQKTLVSLITCMLFLVLPFNLIRAIYQHKLVYLNQKRQCVVGMGRNKEGWLV